MLSQSDSHILTLLETGEMSALNQIWSVYADDMLAYLISLGNTKPEAEDLLQDVFITIARKHQKIAKTEKLQPYLFRMCRNHSINIISKAQRRRTREQQFSTDNQHAIVEENTQSFETMRLALKKLPRKQSTVIGLKFWRKKTFPEIASMLDISENTAASRYRYGMKKLKSLLQ